MGNQKDEAPTKDEREDHPNDREGFFTPDKTRVKRIQRNIRHLYN